MSSSESLLPPLSSAEIEGGVAPIEAVKTSHQKLESTALKATVWTVMSYGVSQSLRLVSNVVLTHLLVPEYFGLIILVSTITRGMTMLSDIGLLPGVIGSPRGDDPVFLDTAWTIQVARGAILWLLALALTIPVAHFYHDTRLLILVPVLSFSIVVEGFASTNLMTSARHIGVRRLLVIDLFTQIFTMAVTIIWAMVWPSMWALVGGAFAGSVLKTIVSHIQVILPGRRNGFAWEKDAVHSLIHFGKWIMLGTAFYFFASQADRLILARLVSFTTLGVYGMAFTFADIPRQIIQQFSYRVGLPFVAKLTHLPFPEFRKSCMKYRFYVLCAGMVILSVVVLGGGPLVTHLYDKRYADAGWMVPILALGLWHTLLYSVTGDILFALGKSKYNAIGTALFCITMFITLPIGFHFGHMFGAVICVAAGDLPFYLVLTIGVAREKVNVWKQDALATAMFLGLLTAGYFLIRMIA